MGGEQSKPTYLKQDVGKRRIQTHSIVGDISKYRKDTGIG